jgi:hypothetical protein
VLGLVAGVALGVVGLGAGAGPGGAVDQRLVGVLDVDVAVGDVAGVDGVGQDAADLVGGPGLAGAGADAAPVQLGGDVPGTVPLGVCRRKISAR